MSLTIKGRPIRFSLKWLRPPPAPPDGSMTLFEHLRELRYRLVVASLAIIAGMIVAWFFRDYLMDVLQRPYFRAVEDFKAKNPENDQITGPTTQPPATQPAPQNPVQDPAPNDARKDL